MYERTPRLPSTQSTTISPRKIPRQLRVVTGMTTDLDVKGPDSYVSCDYESQLFNVGGHVVSEGTRSLTSPVHCISPTVLLSLT